MRHPVMPAAAFLAASLTLVPFVVQTALLRRQYLPSFSLALWLLLANIIYGVDSLIWAGDAFIRVPIWCDITTKFLVGVSYAVPASLFSISTRLRLAALPNHSQVQKTVREQRDSFLVDLTLCIGIPIIAMILYTVIQGHRFDIVESLGCQPEIPAVSVGAIFFWLPALVLSILALVLCCSSWRTIIGPERSWLRVYVGNFDSTLTSHLFFSHVMLVLCTAPLWIAFLVATIYDSLVLGARISNAGQYMTIDWSRIDTYTITDFSAQFWRNQLFCWLTIPIAAFIFSVWFIVFPAAEQINRLYYRIHAYFVRRKIANDSIITLRGLEQEGRAPGRVVVRKCSTVEVRVEDYALPMYSEHTRSYSTSPVKGSCYESRWSIPWDEVRPMPPPDERSTAPSPGGSRGSGTEVIIMELPILPARAQKTLTQIHTANL